MTKSSQKEDSDGACCLPIKKFIIFADISKNKLRKYDKVSDLVNYSVMNYHNQNRHKIQRMVQIVSKYAKDLVKSNVGIRIQYFRAI